MNYCNFSNSCLLVLILAGCATVPEVRTVNVPVRVACVTSVPAKPTRLTPCPKEITNSQCILRAAVDIERLQSAVDQLTTDLEACR